MTGEYSIEVVTLPIVYGTAGHNFLVLRGPDGSVISEMHGLATSQSGEIKPIGYLPSDRLKVYEFSSPSDFYYQDAYPQHTLYQGTLEQVTEKWGAAQSAKSRLNSMNLPYPELGFTGPNSNSVASTLMDQMGFSKPDFENLITPFDDYDLLDPPSWQDYYDSLPDSLKDWIESQVDNLRDEFFDSPFGEMFDDVRDTFEQVRDTFRDATYRTVRYDPLALDLNGDGVVTTRSEEGWTGALFDHNGDGIRSASGWVATSDGLLVRDVDGDGLIDSGGELFGDQTQAANGEMAENGFLALAALDENGDGFVDQADSHFASLQVWRDLNGNGRSESGELQTLDEAGITSLSTSFVDAKSEAVLGGSLEGSGTFTRENADGSLSTGVLEDFNFDSDGIYSRYIDSITVADDIKDLPRLEAIGRLRNLHEAATLSPDLEAAIRAFSSGTTRNEQRQLLEEILQEWAETNPSYSDAGIALHSAGGIEDPNSENIIRLRPGQVVVLLPPDPLPPEVVAMVRVVEALLGVEQPITDLWWGNETVAQYQQIYDNYFEAAYLKLAASTRLMVYQDTISLDWNGSYGKVNADFTALNALLDSRYANNQISTAIDLAELLKTRLASLREHGWSDGYSKLRAWVGANQDNEELTAVLDDLNIAFAPVSSGENTLVSGTTEDDLLIGTENQSQQIWETVRAGDGDDVVVSDGGNDVLEGGGGDDHMFSGSENDQLTGGTGNDVLRAETGEDSLYGNSGDDVLVGGQGRDALHGDADDDYLGGGAGDDYMSGGDGSDVYVFGLGSGHDRLNNFDASSGRTDALKISRGVAPEDIAMWRSGDYLCIKIEGTSDRIDIQNYFRDDGLSEYRLDEIRFADGTVWTIDHVKALVLSPTEGDDDIYGYDSDDVISGGASNDWLSGRGGDDTLSGDVGSDSLSGDDGNDSLHGEAGNDALSGGAGTDNLTGGGDQDRLEGGEGNDRLDGGVGNDRLIGGRGNDVYVFARGFGIDTVDNFDSDVGRTDAIEFASDIASADVNAIRVGADLQLTITGTSDQLTIQGFFQNDATGTRRVDEFRFTDGTIWHIDDVKAMVQVATDGNDELRGYAGNDVVTGGLGDDSLIGAGGNDQLSGDAGADLLQGDEGDDILSGNEGSDTLAGGLGNDELFGGAAVDALTGGDGQDRLEGGSQGDWLHGGIGDDVLLGQEGNDQLIGADGSDSLRGGLGDDRLTGGAGDDSYRFVRGDGKDVIDDVEGQTTILVSELSLAAVYFRRSNDDLIVAFTDSANDEIRLEGFFDPTSGLAQFGLRIDQGDGIVRNLTPADLDLEVLKATAASDLIYGNSLDNTVTGLLGADVIHGEGGADILHGNEGADTLDGGEGNDQLNAGDGVDALSGAGGNDVLNGEGGNDTIDGGIGTDQLAGGAGDDSFAVDDVLDVVIEVAAEGNDIIRSSVSYTLPDHVETLELTGSADIDGTGSNAGDTLRGNQGGNRLDGLTGADTLQGLGGNDALLGGAGDDMLDGGSGIDDARGGLGNDRYQVDVQADTIVEQAAEGIDTVDATSDYVLSEHVERLNLVEGSSARDATGNAGDNEIVGNSAANRLDGAAGADRLTGGTGDDTYVVDASNDLVVELTGQGTDTVESSVDYVLDDTLEHLTLLGGSDLQGTGNAGFNVLTGNSGDNRLDGAAGDDDLYGGAGDDYFVTDSAGDRVYEHSGEGLDTVERRFESNLVLADNVENMILADGITTGNGNELDNVVTGNSGDNSLGGWDGADELNGLDGNDSLFGGNAADRLLGGVGGDYLDGGTGIDQLEGGAGSDTYIVDDTADVVIEASGSGDDKVQTTASHTLTDNVETLFLMGGGAISGTGNALNNYMAGNGADNALSGQGGSDTMAGGAGNDTLDGGLGDDKYIVDATSGSDVIDNAAGGFDGVFFTNGITRERLSFTRDGDDLLISVDDSTTPTVRVLNHFLGGEAAIDYVQPDGGYYLTTEEINQIVAGGGTGGEYDQVVEGTTAGEQLVGSSGKDLVKGLLGDDSLFGMGANDTLQGGDGADYLAGGDGSGSGSGDDRLEGGAGNDTLTGEDGNNVLIGGAGDDDYVYGGGHDTIDTADGGSDVVFFNDGIDASRLGFSRDGDDLVITVDADPASTVRVSNHFLGGEAAIDFVQPDGGSMLDTAAINALVDGGSGGGDTGGGDPGGGDPGNNGDYPSVVEGTAAGEQLLGTTDRDLIRGLGGADTLFGFQGDDKFEGGDGDDYLSGGNGSFSGSGNDILLGGIGADTLVGEDGNDQLFGGAGDDHYYHKRGSGSDVIDNTGGGTDWVFFNDGIEREHLSFHQDGDDLVIRVDGDPNNQVRVLNHFLGGESAIAYVQPSSGYAIPASQFGGLLTPMPASAAGSNFTSEPISMSTGGNMQASTAPEDMSTGGNMPASIGSESVNTGGNTPAQQSQPGDEDSESYGSFIDFMDDITNWEHQERLGGWLYSLDKTSPTRPRSLRAPRETLAPLADLVTGTELSYLAQDTWEREWLKFDEVEGLRSSGHSQSPTNAPEQPEWSGMNRELQSLVSALGSLSPAATHEMGDFGDFESRLHPRSWVSRSPQGVDYLPV